MLTFSGFAANRSHRDLASCLTVSMKNVDGSSFKGSCESDPSLAAVHLGATVPGGEEFI